ncbi:unnamed protein product [Cuscuta campestris]|uniref:Uncharacterized protein n=1 Tax=Cuscuta campestris TaxID=132261 RepID=A0A484NF54_9ASTE|nr:unnamed protein product [Cuscuta campestris]
MEKSSWYHAIRPLLNLVEMLAGDFPGIGFSFFSTPPSNTSLFKPDAGGERNIKAGRGGVAARTGDCHEIRGGDAGQLRESS